MIDHMVRFVRTFLWIYLWLFLVMAAVDLLGTGR